jgi:hypothetical protein
VVRRAADKASRFGATILARPHRDAIGGLLLSILQPSSGLNLSRKADLDDPMPIVNRDFVPHQELSRPANVDWKPQKAIVFRPFELVVQPTRWLLRAIHGL